MLHCPSFVVLVFIIVLWLSQAYSCRIQTVFALNDLQGFRSDLMGKCDARRLTDLLVRRIRWLTHFILQCLAFVVRFALFLHALIELNLAIHCGFVGINTLHRTIDAFQLPMLCHLENELTAALEKHIEAKLAEVIDLMALMMLHGVIAHVAFPRVKIYYLSIVDQKGDNTIIFNYLNTC